MKRPTALRPDAWGWSFDGADGWKIGPMDLASARVCRLEAMERYADYIEIEITRNTRGDVSPVITTLSDALTHIASLEQQQRLTFQVLESYGVPKERARTTHNGVGVLAQRLERAVPRHASTCRALGACDCGVWGPTPSSPNLPVPAQ